MIFNSFSGFQSSLHNYIHTVTKRVDSIEASTLVGTTTMTSLPEHLILDRKIEELETDRIADCLCIDGLDSRINDGADEMRVGEFIILSPQYFKSHLVATNCEGVYFVGLV